MKKTLHLMLALTLFAAAPAHADTRVGDAAPDFKATDIFGREHSLSDFKGKITVVEWANPDCPFVKKHYGSGNMPALQKEYVGKGVNWLTVNSSAPGKQGNYPASEWASKLVKQMGWAGTTIFLDPDGKVGKSFGAKTTPHLFILDAEGKVIYKGAIDDKSGTDPKEIKTAKNYVKAALDEALAGKPVTTSSTESYGCSVKY